MRDYLEYREPHPLISATQESGEPVTGRRPRSGPDA